ncbi:hypothetical protein [Terriglobus sp. ADX1]|uniref:hypothetical protein n=1 Tax=Terriglobus sp. ADX1 TaxID=2794063 RepID=UPI002FE6067C
MATDLAQSGYGALSAIDSIGEEIDLTSAQFDQIPDAVRVRLTKAHVPGAFHFFFASALDILLTDRTAASEARRVLVAEQFDPFATQSCSFAIWDELVDPPSEITEAPVEPTRLVRDLTGDGVVPINVGIYLLKGQMPQDSTVFRQWARTAVNKLLICLSNEVWLSDNGLMVSLVGPRVQRISVGAKAGYDPQLLQAVTEAASWVYSSTRDLEVRHTLFTNELAREWPEMASLESSFAARAPRALDAAKTAYRAHIREGSKETLKSLSELRKTLNEEVSKVSTQTRDLISTLWKDFAIAATALLSRVALIFADKKPTADSMPMRIILLGTAAFTIVNLYVTLQSNSRFMRIAADNRSVWKQKLFGFLAQDDLQTLADEPVKKSVDAYNAAKRIVIAIYALVILLLIGTALSPFLAGFMGSIKSLVEEIGS